MRIALRQQPAQRREMRHAVDHMRGRQQRRGMQLQRLDRVVAEVLVEPRAPDRAHHVAGLQHRPQPRAAPPRTRPRWRPCSRVITSRMAFASPWRRVPSTMPSSVHSMVCILVPPERAPQRLFRASGTRLPLAATRSSLITKQSGRSRGRDRLRGHAAVKHRKIARRAIEQIGMDQVAPGAVDEIAQPVDLAFGAGIGRDDRLAQRLAFDEVLRQLVERPVEMRC